LVNNKETVIIRFGKHFGISEELLLLRDPHYAIWMLRQADGAGSFGQAQRRLRQLVQVFDAKPIIAACSNDYCGQRAARCSVILGAVQAMWWCDECDAAMLGAPLHRCHMIESYLDACLYVEEFCGGRRPDTRVLIRELAHAKGLSNRVDDYEARRFLHS
jgi:hypothetical protein